MANLEFQSLGTRAAILGCFWLAILLSVPSWLRLTTIERLPLPSKQIEGIEWMSSCAVGSNASAIDKVEQDPRVIQYSKHVRLVFSIMNQDSSSSTPYDSSIIHHLQQHVSPASSNPIGKLVSDLDGLHDFHVESQVQWFAPLHFTPTKEALEEIVEQQVEEEVLADEEVEVEVEVEIGEPEITDETSAALEQEHASTDDDNDGNDSNRLEESEVEAVLPSKPRRTQLVKRKEIRQVPKLQTATKRTTRPLAPRYVVEWDDLKVFVNSAEWSLISTVPPSPSAKGGLNVTDKDAGHAAFDDVSSVKGQDRPFDVMAQTRDLHFLLYVPSRNSAPLLLRDTDGGVSDSNAWLIPQWGGVVILNPPGSSASSNVDQALISSNEPGVARGIQELPSEQVEAAIDLFARQLEILLGLGDSPSPSLNTPDGSDGSRLTDKAESRQSRVQKLYRQRISELLGETVNTLTGIIRLVRKIQNLGVGPEVQQDVQDSVSILSSLSPPSTSSSPDHHLQQHLPQQPASDTPETPAHHCRQLLTTLHNPSRLQHSLNAISLANALANRAFFSPRMLGLLYFPDEHNWAVMVPLFGPLMVSMLVTTLKLLKQGLETKSSHGHTHSRPAKARVSL
ncbi:hypothetical protein BCV70DRAFT_199997 [Testicularia cyperi]|uniref:GPI transamidase component PIG-S n=1 Tax=Testicularia cyperi TaxID=1882483 RepID=A0A317XSI6_9BASI|nr:hypothetical protein BCV70DRAFT_199997 [Testicularia cyperi]